MEGREHPNPLMGIKPWQLSVPHDHQGLPYYLDMRMLLIAIYLAQSAPSPTPEKKGYFPHIEVRVPTTNLQTGSHHLEESTVGSPP